MNIQENQILDSDEQIEKRKRGNSWFAMLLALLSVPLIIIGIGLLIFASVTLAGVVLFTILLLVVGFSLLITAGVYRVFSTERIETRHFSVNEHPHIVVNNEIGTIHINANKDENSVTFQTKRHSRLLGKAVNERNEIRADVERVYSPGPNLPQSIDFTITVPHTTDLELNTNVGDIWVTGISGQLSLLSDIGSIYVKEGLLTGNSVLKTNLGSVNLHEAIDPSGSFQLATETGSVYVILPDDTPFELDASTSLGNITTGVPPRAILKLKSITGSVNLIEESDGRIPKWSES